MAISSSINSLVSIILPNLNTNFKFLEARVSSILEQTFTNWECIIIDGFSTNGSWEYLEQISKKDGRFKSYQFPKEGIYKAWNCGLEIAKGEFIYIAPSDDTFKADFLNVMLTGLVEHEECGIAHCCLEIINEEGNASSKNWDNFSRLTLFNNEVKKQHVRYAPLDGILYCGIGPVFTSITQLLIRKEVFNKLGLFLTDQGATADFEWGMRATLVYNTLHIPKYLATWRIHKEQATDDSLLYSPSLYERYTFFIKHAIESTAEKGLLKRKFNIHDLQYNYYRWAFVYKTKGSKSLLQKIKLTSSFVYTYPLNSVIDIFKKALHLKKEDNNDFIKKKLKEYKLEDNIKLL